MLRKHIVNRIDLRSFTGQDKRSPKKINQEVQVGWMVPEETGHPPRHPPEGPLPPRHAREGAEPPLLGLEWGWGAQGQPELGTHVTEFISRERFKDNDHLRSCPPWDADCVLTVAVSLGPLSSPSR